ncbi:MAG: Parvulin-like protein peptidyl-prolyl isomerase [Candidatus Roizmanbacteria bacterium GW2011_GWA2_34_18]|uniref:Parvulin-like protein peptidyl-prolyl isomerase n=1 Tax=Candidatus Roizmanbacteria bacterium GW2011_GWA2_34_18 TaxID=1618477 RepID=A0A0G0D8S3_9BACT|nr:MAG: Parvulin-like protein peptidyl-prolyl isomerase [Candidatus Roizmanbacteria bacterium GW2011_GWA2_34_18]
MAKIKTKKIESPEYKVTVSKKTFILTIVIILVLVLLFFSKKIFIAATVNGKSISRLAIIKKLEKQGGKKTLETMITGALIRQEAEKRKITVSQKDIDAEMKKIEANVTSQGTTLDQALQNQGMTKNDLIEEIKIQLMLQQMAGDNVKMSNKEIDDFISANKNQQGFDKEIPREQAVAQLKQQKSQQKIQTFLTDLKAKAKINYFVNY